MNPVSPALFARWGPTWGPLVHPERPWWRARLHVVRPNRWRLEVDSAWFRADGLRVDGECSMSEGDSAFDVFAEIAAPRSARIDAELARLDAESPLPAPPPMPGQVWATVGPDYAIVTVETNPETKKVSAVIGRGGLVGHDLATYAVWPPSGVLVAGPTPWGFNIPWSPS